MNAVSLSNPPAGTVCRNCNGKGYVHCTDGDEDCWNCLGVGTVCEMPPTLRQPAFAPPANRDHSRPRKASPTIYLATSGEDVLDQGGPLDTFLAQQLQCWELCNGENVVIWVKDTEECGPRVVAVLQPDGRGGTAVRWM